MYNLYNGDCFRLLPKLIQENIKVDAVICDPPYGIKQAEWDIAFNIEPITY